MLFQKMSWLDVMWFWNVALLNLQSCYLRRYFNLNWSRESNGLSWGLTSVSMPYLDTEPCLKPKTTIPNYYAIPTLPKMSAFLCRELFSRISHCVFVLFFIWSQNLLLCCLPLCTLCVPIYTMCATERMCLRSTH